jgi:hypothetical protein
VVVVEQRPLKSKDTVGLIVMFCFETKREFVAGGADVFLSLSFRQAPQAPPTISIFLAQTVALVVTHTYAL